MSRTVLTFDYGTKSIGVAVGHHASQRATACHAELAGVVDHQQVDAAGLGRLG